MLLEVTVVSTVEPSTAVPLTATVVSKLFVNDDLQTAFLFGFNTKNVLITLILYKFLHTTVRTK